MKKSFIFSLLLMVSTVAGAQNWNTAVTGFSSYDVDEFEKAKTAFETALKHESEYSKSENAKLYYYYGKSVLKTSNESLIQEVKAYNAFETAAKYDDGTYKSTLDVEMNTLKDIIKQRYDAMDHKASDKETIKLYMRVSEIAGYKANVEDYQMMLEKLEE